jgi:hypothetical protein
MDQLDQVLGPGVGGGQRTQPLPKRDVASHEFPHLAFELAGGRLRQRGCRGLLDLV